MFIRSLPDYNRTLTNYGVEIDVSGANENIAIDILNGDVKLGNGVVKGGRYVLKYTSSLSGYQIGDDDEYIVCTNSSKVDFRLHLNKEKLFGSNNWGAVWSV